MIKTISNHIKPYQMSQNVENQGLNYPTHHITIILRLEHNSSVYFSITTYKYYFNSVEVVVIWLNDRTTYNMVSRAVTKAVVKILKKICIRRWDYILSKKTGSKITPQ